VGAHAGEASENCSTLTAAVALENILVILKLITFESRVFLLWSHICRNVSSAKSDSRKLLQIDHFTP